jgi:hypothetical protein
MPLGLRVLQERRRICDPRVGEHHVEASKLGGHPVHEGLHLARVTHVHADGDRPTAALDDLLGHGVSAGDLDVAERHWRALGREEKSGRAPDAERASGDRGDPSPQAHCTPSVTWERGS